MVAEEILRLAIFADIHANRQAFAACLDAARPRPARTRRAARDARDARGRDDEQEEGGTAAHAAHATALARGRRQCAAATAFESVARSSSAVNGFSSSALPVARTAR